MCPPAVPRDQVPVATHIRSTVLLSSCRGLRARGHLDAYLAALAPLARERVLGLTASEWLPIDFAREHYLACQGLGLDRKVIEAIGFDSGRVLNETVLSVVVRLTREVGVTPWTAIASSNKLCARTWQGSAFSIAKLGPKEARVEWVGQPMASIPYFRVAFGAFTQGILSLFSQTVFWRELPAYSDGVTLGYRFSWV